MYQFHNTLIYLLMSFRVSGLGMVSVTGGRRGKAHAAVPNPQPVIYLRAMSFRYYATWRRLLLSRPVSENKRGYD
jgi:hypothetical protein